MGSRERRLREKELRKTQILNAARTLLFKKGLHSTTVSQIADLSELSVGTIYFYYKNKEEIFSALQEEGLGLLYNRIEEICTGESSAEEKIKKIISAYVEFRKINSDYYNIFNYFLSSPETIFSPIPKNRIDGQAARILSLTVDVIKEGIKKGLFKKVDPHRHAIMMWSSIHGLLQFEKIKDAVFNNYSIENLARYITENFIGTMKKTK